MTTPCVAFFVTPHGFGHAARVAAVVEAIWSRRAGVRVELFTRVPPWFFEDSLGAAFGYHDLESDVGFVQADSLREDPAATVPRLAAFLDFAPARLDPLVARLQALGCGLVVADISPLGLAVATRAGLPSVLVENFTWDWIYSAYLEREPRLERFLEPLASLFAGATVRVQTAPVSEPAPGAIEVAPVARRTRDGRQAMRRRLGLGASVGESPMALLSMGGVRWRYACLERLQRTPETTFVIPGGAEEARREGNLLLLPHRSPLYHPDLVAAADAVVGKLGYSITAEASRAGTPFAFVPRPWFPESGILARFVREHLPSFEMSAEDWQEGGWVDRLPELWRPDRPAPRPENGADRIAEIVLERLAR